MRDASEWLEVALAGVSGQRWGAGLLPHGTLALPAEEVRVRETLEIPFRHCLVGPDDHVLKLWGLHASGALKGAPMIRSGLDWSAARDSRAGREPDYNGNFGSRYRDFYLDCGGVADGIWFGGAQCSVVSNVAIRHARGLALKLMNGTTRTRVVDVDIENGEPVDDIRVGTGILLDRCRGVLVENVNLHCLERGIVADRGSSVTVAGAVLEKVDRVSISTLGFEGVGWDWQWPSDTPFDFRGNPGGTRISVAMSKLPGTELFYLDNRGDRRELVRVSRVFTGSRPFLLRLETRWSSWWKRLVVDVETPTWIG